jgi:2-polyprenyl-3-methyl-5-hydroxy-6-metoxy-1,4-benzoquinol methylase
MTPEESERAGKLRASLVAALPPGMPAAARLAAAAAYGPLHTLPGAEAWLQQPDWPQPIRRLLDQQVRQPLEERRLAASIPALTAIKDGVSQAVRTQYEESPYPVWTAAPPSAQAVALDAHLKMKFPLAPVRPRAAGERTDILIAGCGTGQQAVELARQYVNTSVLAVDLSLASLAYAKRQTTALGLDNIEYAQADILHLGGPGRAFDAIVATGVLHHMAEPETGLAVLLSLLKPGGFLLLGLYSERAREPVLAAQRFAAEHGFAATASGIRDFRQAAMALDESQPAAAIVKAADFYSISECRDLVFHVQEHRFTLPQIKAMLAQHGLEFLGFEIAPALRRQYAAAFPDDKPMTDLDCWHSFEMQHPQTFVGMYQFWAQKRG